MSLNELGECRCWDESGTYKYTLLPICVLQISGGLSCIALESVLLTMVRESRQTYAGFWTGALMLLTALVRLVYAKFPWKGLSLCLLGLDCTVILQSVATTVTELFGCYMFDTLYCIQSFIFLNKLYFAIGAVCLFEALVSFWGFFHILLILTDAI
ncbi:unnamed protein product [Calicophoron daubneyi]|uniref:Solute carrier family 66 member 3 n=1 Tax=Calicophoron daubneyi TaxID=300641 RepID=A0AAV2TD28_CALDB